jgi:acyl-CoA synthetase (AMP-forming)/AMP-acid ligase II
VRSFYCGSEIGTVTFNAESDPGLVRSTVGRPLPGVRLAVGGRDAGPLTVTGPMIGIGYRTGAVVTPFPDAAVETTDIGFVDDDGLVHIVGRQDDRVHVGSEVVDPLLIEDKVRDLDGVDDCLAVARPHERLGHVLELHVVRAGRRTLSERDVIAHCRSQGLKGAWVPRSVRWVDVVPKTPAGKPRRTRPRN